jgi:hypothetical protein
MGTAIDSASLMGTPTLRLHASSCTPYGRGRP